MTEWTGRWTILEELGKQQHVHHIQMSTTLLVVVVVTLLFVATSKTAQVVAFLLRSSEGSNQTS